MALLTVTHYPGRIPIKGSVGTSPEPRKDCDGRHGHYQMNDS